MQVFRVRDYKTADTNRNVPPKKLELTTEWRAANFADAKFDDDDWIYFFAELSTTNQP